MCTLHWKLIITQRRAWNILVANSLVTKKGEGVYINRSLYIHTRVSTISEFRNTVSTHLYRWPANDETRFVREFFFPPPVAFEKIRVSKSCDLSWTRKPIKTVYLLLHGRRCEYFFLSFHFTNINNNNNNNGGNNFVGDRKFSIPQPAKIDFEPGVNFVRDAVQSDNFRWNYARRVSSYFSSPPALVIPERLMSPGKYLRAKKREIRII